MGNTKQEVKFKWHSTFKS